MTCVAVKLTNVPAQIGLALAEIETLTGRIGFTVIVTILDKAGFPVAHVALEVKAQVINSLLNGINEYVASVAPGTFTPSTFHWYVGIVPPLKAIAVYVTEVPAQTGLADAAIEIPAGNSGLTVMFISLDKAGLPDAQVALEVNTHVILSPLKGT